MKEKRKQLKVMEGKGRRTEWRGGKERQRGKKGRKGRQGEGEEEEE